jgi:hypothetical protein
VYKRQLTGQSVSMKNIRLYLVIVLAFLCSCSNSLDILDPIDPKPIVYCVINPADSIFYLTLTRTFSGDGNAYDLAHDPNLVFYESADIRLEGWVNEYKVWETQFELSDRSKNLGIFPEVPGYCYESFNNGQIINTITSVRLIINLPGMSSPVFSRIPVLPEPVQRSPSRFDDVINLYPDDYVLKFSIDRDVQYCELLCKFHYQESEEKWVDHSVIFSLRRDIVITGPVVRAIIYPDLFFNKVAANIKPVNDTIVRKFISLDLIFLAGDQYFNDYYDTYINASNLDLPPRGNINNGYGLFTMETSAKYENMILNQQTLDSLSMGYITKKLGFVRW